MRRGEAAQDRRDEVAHVGRALHLLGTRPRDQHVARHPLLEQQLGRLDDRLGVEAPDHRAAVEDVADRHQRHPLVVRHVAPDDRHGRALGQSPRGVVERLAEPVRPRRAGGCEPGEVPDGRLGLDHRAQRGRVRGHHEVLAEAPLESEARHAEARVLVGPLEVARVERRFRDAPGHAALGRVAHLPRHDEPVGLAEQARAGARITSAGIRYSNIEPDQETSAEPRPTGVSARPRRNQCSGGDVALGDGEEARQARLGRQQVVVARVERPVADPEADREQLARRVEQEAEVRLPEEPLGLVGDGLERRTSVDAATSRGRDRRLVPTSGDRDGRSLEGRRRRRVLATAAAASAQVTSSLSAPSPRSAMSGPRDVGERAGRRAASSGQPGGPRRARRRAPSPGRPSGRDGSSASSSCRRVTLSRPAVVADRVGRLPRQRDGVVDARQGGRDRQRLVEHLAAGVRQRQQMPAQVAAVDRRHVGGLERSRGRACRTSCRGGRGALEAARCVASVASSRSTISRVPIQPKSRARDRRQQVHPDVRRRRAVRDDRLGSSW